jgi:hypothetical protein
MVALPTPRQADGARIDPHCSKSLISDKATQGRHGINQIFRDRLGKPGVAKY